MKALEERILTDGKVLPGHVLKVGTFLNHQIDTALVMDMAREVQKLYSGTKITKVLTVEASGIAFAFAVASVLGVPAVFAKKHASSNIEQGVFSAKVHSYTHNNDYNMIVSADAISADDKLLLVDDFLANGAALCGLIEVAEKAGATVAGCAIAIEKGFQKGGDQLRAKGVRVESLAIIESMDAKEGIVYRPQ